MWIANAGDGNLLNAFWIMTIPTTAIGPAPIITFYSYKGGVGRSMAVLNTGALIASRGFRVLIIDFDLEAPGLSHLWGKNSNVADQTPPAGVTELLHDAACKQAEADLFTLTPAELAARYTFTYKLPASLRKSKEASLSIMPSGRLGNGYPALLEKLDLKGLYKDFGEPPAPRSLGQNLILAFKTVLTRSAAYDYILVDSRTGHSEEAGICTRDLADHRMVLSGLNTQNVTGTAEFLTNLHNTFERAKIPLRTPDIILSPIPSSEDDLIFRRMYTATDEFKAALGKKPVLELFIPYHPRLALTEQAYVPPLATSPLRMAYLAIEKRLLSSIGHTDGMFQLRFEELIGSGKGQDALGLLKHWVKLQGQPGEREQQKFGNSYFNLFGRREQLYKKVFPLPEALEILTFIAQRSGDDYGSMEIARRLHAVNEIKAAAFDKVLLKLPSLDSDDLGNYANFLTDICHDHDAAEAFYRRALEADPNHANHLGNYAAFLTDIRQDHDAAEAFYKRALEADPNNANNLGNFAVFLTDIRKEHDAAEALYNRALEADPKNANHLGNYANFLTGIRQDHAAAEVFYKRALEADPKHATELGNYALFLTDIRKDHAAAEAYYKRAFEAEPKDATNLGNYAFFLTNIRHDHDAAEAFYKRALEADPKRSNCLGNYGQFLIGRGRVEEGLGLLRSAWENRTVGELMTNSEFAYSLWLGTCLAGSEESAWESVFKHCIGVGFIRVSWNFDAMLAVAEEKLQPADFKYAKALAAAFLDEAAVPALEKFPRWKKLKALDPKLVNADGSISKQTER
jgi:Tfp pilus assembly protein PilF